MDKKQDLERTAAEVYILLPQFFSAKYILKFIIHVLPGPG